MEMRSHVPHESPISFKSYLHRFVCKLVLIDIASGWTRGGKSWVWLNFWGFTLLLGEYNEGTSFVEPSHFFHLANLKMEKSEIVASFKTPLKMEPNINWPDSEVCSAFKVMVELFSHLPFQSLMVSAESFSHNLFQKRNGSIKQLNIFKNKKKRRNQSQISSDNECLQTIYYHPIS